MFGLILLDRYIFLVLVPDIPKEGLSYHIENNFLKHRRIFTFIQDRRIEAVLFIYDTTTYCMIPPRRNSTRQISHRITIPLLLALRLSHLLLIYPNFHYENHLCYTITNPIHDPTQKELHATNISPQHNSNKNPGRYSFSNFKHRTKANDYRSMTRRHTNPKRLVCSIVVPGDESAIVLVDR